MRMFWTMFFLGSMLLVGVDVTVRRQAASRVDAGAAVETPMMDDNDPFGAPTPRP